MLPCILVHTLSNPTWLVNPCPCTFPQSKLYPNLPCRPDFARVYRFEHDGKKIGPHRIKTKLVVK
eukprot:m.26585 g.26585  ORF g.26585 m.26585 type:complete len:65 (-) comp8266_c0_seq2:287-481(-)